MTLFRGVLGASLLSEMALCPSLWTSDRPFPTVPVFPGLPDLPAIACLVLVGLLVVSVLLAALHPRPRIALWAVPLLGAILVAFDIHRLQPWFYQAMLLFWALGAGGNGEGEERDGWAIIATILSATYVWSGLHKFNAAFAQETFPWLLYPLGFEGLSSLWFLAPILETSAGILLFLPRTRTWGLGLVVAIHGFLLVALGPLGQDSNSVVWPWNLWMPILAFLAFFRNSAPIFPVALRPLRGQAIVVAVALLPAMNLFGRWDDYLSFSLYSGRSESGYLLLNENGVRRLPKSFQPYARSATGREGLDIFRWSMETMNVPPYPQARVYRSIGRRLLQAGVPPDDLTLVVTEKPGFTDPTARQRIVPLLP